MLILRQKVFFDYKEVAEKYGERAAKKLKKERGEIAKKLWKERRHINEDHDFWTTGSTPFDKNRYAPGAFNAAKAKTTEYSLDRKNPVQMRHGIQRKEGEKFLDFYNRVKKERYQGALDRAKEQSSQAISKIKSHNKQMKGLKIGFGIASTAAAYGGYRLYKKHKNKKKKDNNNKNEQNS